LQLACLLTLKLSVEAVTEVNAELKRALAVLLPQLNPALAAPTREHLAALLADPATTLLVAREGEAIVGTATVIVYTSPAWIKARIEDVVVDQAARGRGVGEALVAECLSIARKRGARVAELQSARRREAANRLYPRMGFELRESNVYRITLD
jgi:ribosomal protein S18 acetylase RimI-like enzyme